MRGRYFGLKVLIGILYLGLSVATGLWVLLSWPNVVVNDLGAQASAVPGAYGGRIILVVENRSESPWTDAELFVDDRYLFSIGTLQAGEQLSIPLEQLTYLYAIPRDWSHGHWEGVCKAQQPTLSGYYQLEPTQVEIRTATASSSISLR